MTALTSALDRRIAMELAATEYRRCAELLAALDDREWATETECTGWDVRAMAAHMLGMVEMAASIREGQRQQKLAMASGSFDLDTLTGLQVSEREGWTAQRIAARFAERWPAAVKGRRRTPWFIRRRVMSPGEVNGSPEYWTLGYLLDVILTRDPWTHRMDISRALGRTPELTARHDGVIVADVVRDWSRRHGKDFDLVLTGPAGGRWTVGANGPNIDMDAIEFCRVLSKRPGEVSLDALLSTEVPF